MSAPTQRPPRTVVQWAARVLIALVALLLLLVGVGALLPRDHVAAGHADLAVPADSVWRAITEVERFPEWRTGVQRVERLSAPQERLVWREYGADGRITFQAVAMEPPTRLVSRIMDRDLGFGGEWEYALAAASGGTRITITERGEVYNPVFRLVSRFFIGHTATMDRYLADLERRFEPGPADAQRAAVR